MRGFKRSGLAGALAALGLVSFSVAGAAGDAAAATTEMLWLTVEFDEGLTGNFGSIYLEEKSDGKLAFTITLTPALGPDADLHGFYFNVADYLGIDHLVLSDSRCQESGESSLGSCETDFDLEADRPVRGGAGSDAGWAVTFGNGGGSKGNGHLEAASFELAAFEKVGDSYAPIPLAIDPLKAESYATSSGIAFTFAVHVQSTDLVWGSDSETVGAHVPEPGTAALLGLGLAGLAVAGRCRS